MRGETSPFSGHEGVGKRDIIGLVSAQEYLEEKGENIHRASSLAKANYRLKRENE